MKGIKFEKVSFEQFKSDMTQEYSIFSDEDLKRMYDNIKLPQRSTKGSAGYDFYAPLSFQIKDTNLLICTGIRVRMPSDYFLMLVPRSGLGFKTGTHLANTIGIIDSDYYYSDNEGHIKAKLVPGFNEKIIKEGDGFMQGIFVKYYTTEDDQADGVRNGGFGSTDRK